jgi:5-methylcytosine-specific restriction protein A
LRCARRSADLPGVFVSGLGIIEDIMPSLPPSHRAHAPHGEVRSRGAARERGYDAQWERARASHLRASPLCRYCEIEGRIAAATLVDHLYPHRGDRAVFWRREWWVSACAACHSGWKQALERQGRAALDALARRLGVPVQG